MNQEQIAKIMTPEFIAELIELDTAEEVKNALEQKGISLSVQEIQQLQKRLESQASGDGELSEAELQNVAGGGLLTTISEFICEGLNAMDRWTNRRW